MSSVMVVVPEPAVKGCGAFAVGAVERAVGPAGERGADEAFGLAVGLRAARAGAEVADPECPAGERVDRRSIGGAVVGEQALDRDAVTTVELDGAAQKRDRCRGLLVGQNFGVGQARAVIDGDVHVVPADGLAALALAVGEGAVVVLAAGHPVSGAALDAPELLDVDPYLGCGGAAAGRRRRVSAACRPARAARRAARRRRGAAAARGARRARRAASPAGSPRAR